MRTGSLAIALTLAIAVTTTGCDDSICKGRLVKGEVWTGPAISALGASGAEGVALVMWFQEGQHIAAIEDGVLLHQTDLSSTTPPPVVPHALASAPAGHVLVGGFTPTVLSFDRRGQLVTSPISLGGLSTSRMAAAFDGERFLIAWTENAALKLTSLLPGTPIPATPAVIGVNPGRPMFMASSGGVAWLVWLTESAGVVGLRIMDGAVIDAGPVRLFDDPRLGVHSEIALAASSGRFLLAVSSSIQSEQAAVLVPFGGDAVRGPAVELPGYTRIQPVGEATGFAALRQRTIDEPLFAAPGPLAVARLALDGALLSEEELPAADAALSFDGDGLAVATRADSTADGSSALSFARLGAPSAVPLAATQLVREEVEYCEQIDGLP